MKTTTNRVMLSSPQGAYQLGSPRSSRAVGRRSTGCPPFSRGCPPRVRGHVRRDSWRIGASDPAPEVETGKGEDGDGPRPRPDPQSHERQVSHAQGQLCGGQFSEGRVGPHGGRVRGDAGAHYRGVHLGHHRAGHQLQQHLLLRRQYHRRRQQLSSPGRRQLAGRLPPRPPPPEDDLRNTPPAPSMPFTRLLAAVRRLWTGADAEVLGALLAPEATRALLARERGRACRTGESLSVVEFSPVGPAWGRLPLVYLVRLLRWRLRSTDVLGWLEGGRLAAVLPGATPEGAEALARDVCARLPREVPAPAFLAYAFPRQEASCRPGPDRRFPSGAPAAIDQVPA